MNSLIILVKFPKLTYNCYMYIVSGGFSCTLRFLEISEVLGDLNRLNRLSISEELERQDVEQSCCHSRPFFQTCGTVCHVAIILTQLFLKLFLFWEAPIILLIIGAGLPGISWQMSCSCPRFHGNE